MLAGGGLHGGIAVAADRAGVGAHAIRAAGGGGGHHTLIGVGGDLTDIAADVTSGVAGVVVGMGLHLTGVTADVTVGIAGIIVGVGLHLAGGATHVTVGVAGVVIGMLTGGRNLRVAADILITVGAVHAGGITGHGTRGVLGRHVVGIGVIAGRLAAADNRIQRELVGILFRISASRSSLVTAELVKSTVTGVRIRIAGQIYRVLTHTGKHELAVRKGPRPGIFTALDAVGVAALGGYVGAVGILQLDGIAVHGQGPQIIGGIVGGNNTARDGGLTAQDPGAVQMGGRIAGIHHQDVLAADQLGSIGNGGEVRRLLGAADGARAVHVLMGHGGDGLGLGITAGRALVGSGAGLGAGGGHHALLHVLVLGLAHIAAVLITIGVAIAVKYVIAAGGGVGNPGILQLGAVVVTNDRIQRDGHTGGRLVGHSIVTVRTGGVIRAVDVDLIAGGILDVHIAVGRVGYIHDRAGNVILIGGSGIMFHCRADGNGIRNG